MTLNAETTRLPHSAAAAFEAVPTDAALSAEVRTGDLRIFGDLGFARLIKAWRDDSVMPLYDPTLSDHDSVADASCMAPGSNTEPS